MMKIQPVQSNCKPKAYIIFFAIVLFAFSTLLMISIDTEAMLPEPTQEPVITEGTLGGPVRMDNFSRKLFLVADYSNGAILFVSKDDTSIVQDQFSINGTPQEVVKVRDKIVVMNRTSRQLEVYNKSGVFKFPLNVKPDIDPNITGLAADTADNLVFAVSSKLKEIQVYKVRNNNSLLFSFGSDVLNNATGITLDPDNRLVYVSDYGNYISNPVVSPAIHVFDYAGIHLRKIQGPDFGFVKPQGLALDENLLYVTDCHNGNVKVINLDTMTLDGVICEYGSNEGQALLVLDVAVDKKENAVYVLDFLLGRIQKFSR